MIVPMKLRFPLLLSTLSLIALPSCGQIDHPEPVALEFGTEIGMDAKMEGYSHLTRIDGSDLTAKIEAKENFVLIAHSATRLDCTCFSTWHNEVLAPYIARHRLLVYLIDMSEVSGEGKENYGMKLNSLYATLAIFKEGTLAYQHGTSDENDKFVKDRTEFAAWMNYRIQHPTMFYISKDQLDEKYEDTEQFTILFSRSTCGDCAYFQSHMLKDYLAKTEHLSDAFILDCDSKDVRYVVDEAGKEWGPSNAENANEYQKAAYTKWNAFKEEYGLAESDDNPAGWKTGFVPTIYHINPEGNGKKIGDVIDGAAVLFNDSIENDEITSSYFTAERLNLECLSYLKEDKTIADSDKVVLGKKVSAQGERSRSAYFHEEQAKFHDPIAKAFLDTFIGN